MAHPSFPDTPKSPRVALANVIPLLRWNSMRGYDIPLFDDYPRIPIRFKSPWKSLGCFNAEECILMDLFGTSKNRVFPIAQFPWNIVAAFPSKMSLKQPSSGIASNDTPWIRLFGTGFHDPRHSKGLYQRIARGSCDRWQRTHPARSSGCSDTSICEKE